MELSFLISRVCDVLFPPTCVTCQLGGAWWCDACRSRVERVSGCIPLPCGIDSLAVAGFYHDPVLRGAIHALKFRGVTSVVPSLMRICACRLRLPHGAVFQPCLAAASRVRERGFDQSVMLATSFAQLVDGQVCDVLKRLRDDGIPQSTITEHEIRRVHAERLFALRPDVLVPRHVILVDDIVTTGSTMSAAALVLRAAGVERVDAVALALGK